MVAHIFEMKCQTQFSFIKEREESWRSDSSDKAPAEQARGQSHLEMT
jgi:hypothetical protein